MKTNSKNILLLSLLVNLLWSGFSSAQEKIPGPFAFVNALDSEQPTFIFLNGESYKPKGYKSGQMTYGGRTWSGRTNVLAENSELGSDSISVDISPTSSPIIIAYAKLRELPDGTLKRELELKEIPNQSKNKGVLSGIYASNTGNSTLIVNSQKYFLEPFDLTFISKDSNFKIQTLTSENEPRKFTFDTPTHRIGVVYDLKSGNQNVIMFEDISGNLYKDDD